MKTNTKKWYTHRKLWVGVVALLAGIGSIWGFDLAPEFQASLAEALTSLATSLGSGE